MAGWPVCDDVADDALAIAIAILPLAVAGNARRGGDDQLAAVGRQQHHRAANQRQPFFQQLEHFRKHLPLAVLRGQEPSDLGQDPKILLVRVNCRSTVLGPLPS